MNGSPTSWTVRPLHEVVALQRGFDLPHEARRPGPFKVLTSGKSDDYHDRGPIKGPGIAIGRATNLGRPKWSEGDFWPHNTTLFVRDFKKNSPRWVFHMFEMLDLSGYDSGSVQPMLNRNYIAQVSINVPPPFEQRSIAEVLGALDDKIAANTRLAATADELATAEFRSAVAGVAFSDQSFADLAHVYGGGTPKTKVLEFWDNGTVPWASPTDITKLKGPYLFDTGRKITDAGLASCSSSLYPVGSILMTSRATIGSFALAEVPVAVNQGFIVVVAPDMALRYWLFHEMRDRIDEFLSHANGATFLELSRGNFRRLPVRLPERREMMRFSELAGALHSRASVALRENTALTQIRDVLLPALMSGRLRVKEAEHIVEDLV